MGKASATGKDYVYVTKDFRNMSESERNVATVRTGKIDAVKVFEHLTGRQLGAEEAESVEQALKEAGNLSRCHHDLLVTEFGETESTFGETVRATDVLTDSPADACAHKLDEALSLIAEKLSLQHGSVESSAQWTEVELSEDQSEVPGTDDKKPKGDHYDYMFDDEAAYDENLPTGTCLLLGVVFAAGIIAACCGVVKVIWKLFSHENN